MLNKRLCSLVTVILACSLAASCAAKKPLTGNLDKPKAEAASETVYKAAPAEQQLSLVNKTESGPTNSLPWEKDPNFLRSQAKSATPILMAAYRTVLHDPLPGEEENVHLAARMLAGTVVKPGKVFSQNAELGPYVRARGYQKGPTYSGATLITTVGGGVCKIASTLYNVTVLSNLRVVERHAHSMPVPYVPYGQDATVSYGVRDFKFKNTTDSPVLIWAQGVDNVLYIGFYGTEHPPVVEWHHQTIKVIKAGAVYQYNPSLPPKTKKLVVEGMDGGVVESWVTVNKGDGRIE
ncbi:MAG TPA: VanW family protein, partial [Bacillota bacterium]|nr:VanW family protein [Bacillota bacterium]